MLGIAYAALYFGGAFAITSVKVNGADHLTNDEMAILAAVPQGTTLLNVDTSSAVSYTHLLGMALGCLAVVTKTEFVVIIIGGLFVAEALSVMIQVFYYKKTKKRIFLMAPLHHHFEKKGWSETKVVVRFWIVSGMLAACGFVLYFATTLGA